MLAGCVNCYGNEKALLQCQTSATGIVSCSHNDDAGVECIGMHLHYSFVPIHSKCKWHIISSVTAPCQSGDVRLAGSSDPLRGRVEVCVNETWGTICEDFWDTNDTSVVCTQLGFSAEGKCKLYIFNNSTGFLGLMLQSCNCCELFKGFAILVAILTAQARLRCPGLNSWGLPAFSLSSSKSFLECIYITPNRTTICTCAIFLRSDTAATILFTVCF